MYQAYAHQLLNQKESEIDSSMNDVPEHPLYGATKRLVDALNRLEDNLKRGDSKKDAQQDQQLQFFEKENESLKEERENLNSAISQLKHQYDDLHNVASTIYGKLDDAIKRLTQIIRIQPLNA